VPSPATFRLRAKAACITVLDRPPALTRTSRPAGPENVTRTSPVSGSETMDVATSPRFDTTVVTALSGGSNLNSENGVGERRP